MEQRPVVRCLTLRGLKSGQIIAELKMVYELNALALSTVRKGCKRFLEGRLDLSDNPTSERPLAHDLAEAIRSVLQKRPTTSRSVLCRHLTIASGSCLRILQDDLALKNAISAGVHTRWTRTPGMVESVIRSRLSRHWSRRNRMVSGVTRLRQNPDLDFLQGRNKNVTPNSS
jgi:hypothetical protein